MNVYYSLRNLALVFGWLRREFSDLAGAILKVWLIGSTLSSWFYSISELMGDGETRVYDLVRDWYDFYIWVRNNLTVDLDLSELIRYADDLISFIRYPFDWILDAIRAHYPEFQKIARDPISYILETIYRYTGLSYTFVHNPKSVVRDWINEMLGDVIEIARNPRAWLIDKLDDIFPAFYRLITDARGWVRDRIEEEFPGVIEFMRDPDDFIENAIIEALERLADKYLQRVIKIGEKVLQAIF
jgi:hypothetical protein